MHSAFAQFLAIGQKDEADNLKAMETKLAMPVLAIGAEKAFGANVAAVMRNAATNVQESRRAERRPLADGGSSRGDDRGGAGLPRGVLSPAGAPSLRPLPLFGGLFVALRGGARASSVALAGTDLGRSPYGALAIEQHRCRNDEIQSTDCRVSRQVLQRGRWAACLLHEERSRECGLRTAERHCPLRSEELPAPDGGSQL